MVSFDKCEKCLHNPVCAFKKIFITTCNALTNLKYSIDTGGEEYLVMDLQDSEINVTVHCPHMLKEKKSENINFGSICP